jgi:hypothetical protein
MPPATELEADAIIVLRLLIRFRGDQNHSDLQPEKIAVTSASRC